MSALRFIARSTVVNVQKVQITDCFSDDFRWYWINVTHEQSSTGANVDMRYLSNGVPYAGSTYQMAGQDNDSFDAHNTVNFSDTERVRNLTIMDSSDDAGGGFQLWIVNPNHHANTIGWLQTQYSSGNNQSRHRRNAYANEDTLLYDGMEFSSYGSTNTINSDGWFTIDVYGLQQS
jgi:hypothetical protein